MKYKVIDSDRVIEAPTKQEAFEIFKKNNDHINLFDIKPVIQIEEKENTHSNRKTPHLKELKEVEKVIEDLKIESDT
jgi:hypothetical protein